MRNKQKSAWRLPLAVMTTGFIGLAWLSLAPIPGQPVAAVFPPWWDTSRTVAAIAAAGGDILRPGAWPAIMIGFSTDPAFTARLRAEGAWLLLNPQALGTCGAIPQTNHLAKAILR
jgi:hypothetical protein